MFVVCGLLPAVCLLLSLCVAGCVMFARCCLLLVVVRCVLFVVRYCLVVAVRCMCSRCMLLFVC